MISIRKRIKSVPGLLLLLFISAISLYPFYFMLTMSTHQSEEFVRAGASLQLGNYFMNNVRTVLRGNYLQAYGNSLYVSVLSTLFSVLFCAMAGYGVTIYQFKMRAFFRRFIVLTLLIPAQIGITGYLMEMRALGLTRTHIPLIVNFFAHSFGCYWMMQYMENSLEKEIVESARIDGSSELRTFFTIVIPLIMPAIVSLIMLIFLWSWNSYLLPLVLITRQKMFTIPLYIQSLTGEYRTDYGAQATGLFLATIPLVILFVIGSKYFVKGLTSGAVKG